MPYMRYFAQLKKAIPLLMEAQNVPGLSISVMDKSRLGSVVTNHGYSDWATTDISSSIKEMWYRLSRRESDYYIETSTDGINFKQMRAFHLFEGAGEISFGIYACSPTSSSYKATFTNMAVTECKWEKWSVENTGFSQID